MAGSARGHRQLAIAASDTSEGGAKDRKAVARSATGPLRAQGRPILQQARMVHA